MFTTIAPRYDFITRVFSYRMDEGWKQRALSAAGAGPGQTVLDLACGTGDFTRLASAAGARVVACDLTPDMLKLARKNGVNEAVGGDAVFLPFPDGLFDSVFIGYGVRNFHRLRDAVLELRRVLKPGGRLVVLDFFLPRNRVWRWMFLGYLYVQGAFWGAVLHGKPSIYTYIPRSLVAFLSIDAFEQVLRGDGFHEPRHEAFLGGGIAIVSARQ